MYLEYYEDYVGQYEWNKIPKAQQMLIPFLITSGNETSTGHFFMLFRENFSF